MTDPRNALADDILAHLRRVTPGVPVGAGEPNPLVRAYHSYRAVRGIIAEAKTDTYDDLYNNRPTASAVDSIVRFLRTGRAPLSVYRSAE